MNYSALQCVLYVPGLLFRSQMLLPAVGHHEVERMFSDRQGAIDDRQNVSAVDLCCPALIVVSFCLKNNIP